MNYNIGSLLLGLAAWILPLAGLALRRRRWVASACSTASFGAALLALVLQLFEIRRRVDVGDFSAIMDTIHAVCGAAVVLAVVTILLNLALLWGVSQERDPR